MSDASSGGDDTLYGILEVTPNATFEEIESAFERLMAYLAVDSMALYSMGVDPEDIGEQRIRVEEAFRVLSDPQLRAAYDDARRGGDDYPSIMVPESPSDGDTSMSVVRFDDDDDFDDGPGDDSAAFIDEVLPGLAAPVAEQPKSTHQEPASAPPGRGADPVEPEEASRSYPPARSEPSPGAGSVAEASSVAEPAPLPRSEAAPLPRGEPAPLPRVEQTPPPGESATAAPLASAPPRAVSPRSEPPPPKILPAGPRDQPRPGRRRLFPTVEAPVIAPDTEIGGGVLKRLRESCDASLVEVANITKINKRYLRAIEDNDFEAMPAKVYVRGFVFEYARALGLDPQVVTRCYLRLYERYKAEIEES